MEALSIQKHVRITTLDNKKKKSNTRNFIKNLIIKTVQNQFFLTHHSFSLTALQKNILKRQIRLFSYG